jgi:exopolysaccharide biosynthesis WecB/TagA/CpsF family protein
MEPPKKNSIFNGITLHDYDVTDVMQVIFSGSLAKRSYIVTPNIDHFFRLDLAADKRFNHAYKNSDIVVCDSRIARILSRLEQKPIRKICPGSDLTEKLLKSKEIKEKSILVVGSHPDLIRALGLKHELPNINCYSPPMGFIKNPAELKKCVDFLLSCNADIVFLALGSPQQEILACTVKSTISPGATFNGVMLCIGASLDFLTGVSTRAPLLIQKLNLEWLHRALSNPSRLIPRYCKNLHWIIVYTFKKTHLKLFSITKNNK